MKIVILIQARVSSTRFPNKVMQLVGGVPMVKRVFLAAKASMADVVKVAWPERYPGMDENNVLARFRLMVMELDLNDNDIVVRLTADCPLLTASDINKAICTFIRNKAVYFNNGVDGKDVQVCKASYLFDPSVTHTEHVFLDTAVNPNIGGDSVNTKSDLEKVKTYVNR